MADLSTLSPKYYTASNDFRDIKITFQNHAVNGLYYDKMTFTQSPIADAVNGNFFDSSLSTYVLSWLPLRDGYYADIPIYAVNTATDHGVKTMSTVNTSSTTYRTSSGKTVPVFYVEVMDQITQLSSQYYIGKNDRTIYEIATPTENGLMRLLRVD